MKTMRNIVIGFCLFITSIFAILKTTQITNWSWLWILSPIWIPLLAFTVLYIICMLLALCIVDEI